MGILKVRALVCRSFLAFNAIALPIAIVSDQPPLIKMLVGLFAVLVHYAILLGAIRANDWINFWDLKLKTLEELDENGEKALRLKVFSDSEFESMRSSWSSTRYSFIPIALIAICFWILDTIYNFHLLLK